MAKIILKALFIIGVGIFSYGMVGAGFDHSNGDPSYPGLQALLSSLAVPLFVIFSYRFWNQLRGWQWFLLLNFIVGTVGAMLGNPAPAG